MKRTSILIIDDNEEDRYLLKRQLKDTGLSISKVFEEEDGETALEFFKNYEANHDQYPNDYPPVLAFLDINMPLVGGYEFLKKFSGLRKRADLKSIIIMMFSSSDRKEDKKNAMKYSFVKDYLVKGSFDSEELKEKIEKLDFI